MNEALISETLPEIIKTTSSGISIIKSGKWIIDYFAGHEPAHVKERLGRNWELMLEYIHEKNQSKDPGDAWRNDWFAENQVSNHRILLRLLEKTIKEIINDSEERKSKYVGKFWVNICLTSNFDIDEATAFSYFETIESLSWRQLCIIRFIVLLTDQELEYYGGDFNDVKQMAQDEQTSFHSISRDFEKLMDAHYIQYVSMTTDGETHEPYASHPGLAQLPASTDRLHSLMNLNEIPIEDIVKTFSPWKVRPRKSE